MTKFVAILTSALVLGLATSANAQASQQTKLDCKPVTMQPADGGFKRIGVRVPKLLVNGARVTRVDLRVEMPVAQARSDQGLPEPKINAVFDCGDKGIGISAKVEHLPDHDATEIVVPETFAKGTKIHLCSQANGCFVGSFEDFAKWVTLAPAGASTSGTKVTGRYN